MIKALIISIIIGIITNGVQGAINYFKSKKVKTLKKELEDEKIKLAEEIRRSQEKRQQVEDLLKFQSADKEIVKKMNDSVDVLEKARSKQNVKKELKKMSTRVRDIYMSN